MRVSCSRSGAMKGGCVAGGHPKVVEGKDCAMRRIFRGKGKDQDSETKEEADAQDLKDMTRLDAQPPSRQTDLC